MHPDLEPILSETYGIFIYQEQVQQAAQVLSGYTLGRADILRRAMGKKIKAEMDGQRQEFIDGAAKNNIEKQLASDIFNKISAFADYGFNKSHAAAYALIAWQTAWLKAHYPADFIAASMTYDRNNTDKLSVFRQDCISHDITVIPPCINASEARFTVELQGKKPSIRYALGAIRNVGVDAMRQLVEERQENGQFTSIDDFITRMSGSLSRHCLESLTKAGALDSLEVNRAKLLAGLELMVNHGHAIKRDKESDQNNLFGGSDSDAMKLILPDAASQPSKLLLEDEFEALGLYISAHPMDDYADKLASKGIIRASDIEEEVKKRGQTNCRINLAGIVTSKRIRTSSKGNRFAIVQLTDQSGSFEITLFSDALAAAKDLLDADTPIMIKADARIDEGAVRLLGQSLRKLDDAMAAQSKGLEIKITDPDAVVGIKEGLVRDGAGMASLVLSMQIEGRMIKIPVPGNFKLSSQFRQMVKLLPGITAVRELN